jgi:hypothetical protein
MCGPSTDPFSTTVPDKPLRLHDWATCVVFAWLYRHGGVAGLMVLHLLVSGATYAIRVALARRLGAGIGAICTAYAVLMWVATPRGLLRAHLVSSLFLVAFVWILVEVRQGHLRERWLGLIVPLTALWGNLHGGWPQGVEIVSIWAGVEAFLWWRAHPQALPGRTVLHLLAGCDRTIPNALRSLLPGFNLRPLLVSHRHGLRRQVPLMDDLPNTTKPDHPKVQDDLSACDGP